METMIKIRESEAVINFNSSFYPLKAIEEAYKVFLEVCDIKMDGFKVTISKDIAFDFSNYVLGLVAQEMVLL